MILELKKGEDFDGNMDRVSISISKVNTVNITMNNTGVYTTCLYMRYSKLVEMLEFLKKDSLLIGLEGDKK